MAVFRHSFPIIRSRVRTPDSRVYPVMTARRASSPTRRADFFSPCSFICLGSR